MIDIIFLVLSLTATSMFFWCCTPVQYLPAVTLLLLLPRKISIRRIYAVYSKISPSVEPIISITEKDCVIQSTVTSVSLAVRLIANVCVVASCRRRQWVIVRHEAVFQATAHRKFRWPTDDTSSMTARSVATATSEEKYYTLDWRHL